MTHSQTRDRIAAVVLTFAALAGNAQVINIPTTPLSSQVTSIKQFCNDHAKAQQEEAATALKEARQNVRHVATGTKGKIDASQSAMDEAIALADSPSNSAAAPGIGLKSIKADDDKFNADVFCAGAKKGYESKGRLFYRGRW